MALSMSGSDADFDALVYGQPHPGTLNFIQSTLQNATQHVSEASQQFFQRAHQAYDYFHGHEAVRRSRAALRRAGALFVPDDIRELETLGQIQAAQDRMRRYIMADPYIRGQYQAQRIEGYSDKYMDVQPEAIGEDHYDYQRLMDGLVREDDEGRMYYVVHYGIDDGDQMLSHEEQLDILNTQARVRYYIKKGKEDPTSIWGALL